MIFGTETNFINESSKKILYQIYLMGNYILPTITNKSIITKIHQNSYRVISAVSTKHPINNGGQPIIVREMLIPL